MPKPVDKMTPSEINRRLESVGKKSSRIMDKLIAAGRGRERFAETLKKTDPLARQLQTVNTEYRELQDEIARRWGPGRIKAPLRNPAPARRGYSKEIKAKLVKNARAALEVSEEKAIAFHGLTHKMARDVIVEFCDENGRKKNPAGRFTVKQLNLLRKYYEPLTGIDPGSPTYRELTALLDSQPQAQLKQLAGARIKFLSSLARNRIKRKGNPTMPRKKKRTAKQLANDRRLGRMAKARAKAKRKGKRKTARRKTRARRANPKRTTRAKSHLWRVFKCKGKDVRYMTFMSDGRLRWTLTRGDATLFPTIKQAKFAAQGVQMLRGGELRGWQVGIAPYEKSGPQIASECAAGKG